MFSSASGSPNSSSGNEDGSSIRAAQQDEPNEDEETDNEAIINDFLGITASSTATKSASRSPGGGESPSSSKMGDIGSASEYPSEYVSLPSADKAEGSIKLNISNLTSLRTKMTTSYHMIANLPWRLAAKTECSKRTSNVKYFSVYIDCNPESESTLWACDAQVEFKLISQRPGVADYTRQFTNRFNFSSNNWGFPSFLSFDTIISEEKGYIRGDRVLVEARIVVNSVTGVKKSPTFDFRSPQQNISDVVLLIDGTRIYVSKAYLALYSPVFNAMFFSKFSERSMREIPMEDVMLDEFEELMKVVYPSHKSVTAENVEFLLELGDKFEIQYVMDECENFLIRTEDINVTTKLVWSDQFCMAKLHDACIRTLKTVSDIKSLKSSEEYKNFSDTTKAALLEKMLKLVQ